MTNIHKNNWVPDKHNSDSGFLHKLDEQKTIKSEEIFIKTENLNMLDSETNPTCEIKFDTTKQDGQITNKEIVVKTEKPKTLEFETSVICEVIKTEKFDTAATKIPYKEISIKSEPCETSQSSEWDDLDDQRNSGLRDMHVYMDHEIKQEVVTGADMFQPHILLHEGAPLPKQPNLLEQWIVVEVESLTNDIDNKITTADTSVHAGTSIPTVNNVAISKKRTRNIVENIKNDKNKCYTNPNQYICDDCGEGFKTKIILINHLKVHRIMKREYLYCGQCRYKTVSRNILNNHTIKKHGHTPTGDGTFKCKHCNYESAQKCVLQIHLLTHTEQKSYNCSICNYKCLWRSRLKAHMLTHTGEKPYSCTSCNHKYYTRSDLNRHTLIHTAEKRYSCTFCDYKSSWKNLLRQHMSSHTGDKPYNCSNCNFRCVTKSGLKRHVLIHTNEKPFSCTVCSFKCNRKGHLRRHLLTHTGEKPHACSLCDYKSSQKSNLKQHLFTHAAEKPYNCTDCDYKCANKSNFGRHLLTHTGGKCFKCTICSFECSRKALLRQHLLEHTGVQYNCTVCDQKFVQKDLLKRHLLVHTGEESGK